MRFIVYAKLPDCVDLLPLDIIDDRPSRNVLEDILVLAKILPFQSRVAGKYKLKKSSLELDLDLRLADNKIKNGDVLELIIASDQVTSSANKLSFEKVVLKEKTSDAIEMPENVAQISLKTERPNVPGKKVDFD
jgi:hypothetical protein